MFTPEQLQALGALVQQLALLVAAVASLYAAIHGRSNAAKIDKVAGQVETVQTQTNGLSAALATATGNAAFEAGVAGQPNPTPGTVAPVADRRAGPPDQG